MKATALKPPRQSINAEQTKDDRRHLSAKRSLRINAAAPLTMRTAYSRISTILSRQEGRQYGFDKKSLKPAVILL